MGPPWDWRAILVRKLNVQSLWAKGRFYAKPSCAYRALDRRVFEHAGPLLY